MFLCASVHTCCQFFFSFFYFNFLLCCCLDALYRGEKECKKMERNKKKKLKRHAFKSSSFNMKQDEKDWKSFFCIDDTFVFLNYPAVF